MNGEPPSYRDADEASSHSAQIVLAVLLYPRDDDDPACRGPVMRSPRPATDELCKCPPTVDRKINRVDEHPRTKDSPQPLFNGMFFLQRSKQCQVVFTVSPLYAKYNTMITIRVQTLCFWRLRVKSSTTCSPSSVCGTNKVNVLIKLYKHEFGKLFSVKIRTLSTYVFEEYKKC